MDRLASLIEKKGATMGRSVSTFLSLLAAGALVLSPFTSALAAQEQAAQDAAQPAQQQDDQSQNQNQKSGKKGKEKAKSDNQLKKELDSPYKKWLDEDVI